MIFFWILFSFVVAAYASSKKIPMGFFGGLFVSLVFSPVIGLIAVIATKPSDDKIVSSGEMKKCPDCAELVKNDALKCRYCGKAFSSEMKKDTPTEKKPPTISELLK